MIKWLAIGSVSLYHVAAAETHHLFAMASLLLCIFSVFIVPCFICVCIYFPRRTLIRCRAWAWLTFSCILFPLSFLNEFTFHSLACCFILKREILLLREFTTGLYFSMKHILNGCSIRASYKYEWGFVNGCLYTFHTIPLQLI